MTPLFPTLLLTTDSIKTDAALLMGRQSAGRGFLRAMCRAYADAREPMRIVHLGQEQEADIEAEVRSAGWSAGLSLVPLPMTPDWIRPGVLYYPAPVPARLAWLRARHGEASMALFGVTHTICQDLVLRTLADYVHCPVHPWDALVCTSEAVRQVVRRVWQSECEQLARRLGLPQVAPPLPMTPVIPLGVYMDDVTPDPALRASVRADWGFGPEDVVVLFVGRLDPHAKANPWPMYEACARVAAQSGRSLRLLECGWFPDDASREMHEQAAAVAGVRVTRIDGRMAGVARQAYAAADIFVSLSDNIQESFGLTPVEAMAAGLPVVASAWNGYRESVRDGIEGFLVPTAQPVDPACGEAVRSAHEDGRLAYGDYIAHAHLLASVDVPACTQALRRLVEDADLRRRMGQAGRDRARAVYDWPVVMRQYQELWAEQERRRAAGAADAIVRRNPAYANPLELFAHYSTVQVSGQGWIWRAPDISSDDLCQRRALRLWSFADQRLAPEGPLLAAWQALPGEDGVTIEDWARGLGWPLEAALRQALWLHKAGLVCLGVAGLQSLAS